MKRGRASLICSILRKRKEESCLKILTPLRPPLFSGLYLPPGLPPLFGLYPPTSLRALCSLHFFLASHAFSASNFSGLYFPMASHAFSASNFFWPLLALCAPTPFRPPIFLASTCSPWSPVPFCEVREYEYIARWGPFQLSKGVGNAIKHVPSKLDQTAIAGPSHLHQQLGPKGLWSNLGTASGSSYLQGEVSSCQQLSSQCSCPRIYHALCCSCLLSIPASCSLLLSISQYLPVCLCVALSFLLSFPCPTALLLIAIFFSSFLPLSASVQLLSSSSLCHQHFFLHLCPARCPFFSYPLCHPFSL